MSRRSFRLPQQWSAAILVAACVSNPDLPVAVQAAPRQVLLIRHGHKLGDGGNFNLSRQGLERVSALAGLIPACFGEVTHIVTLDLIQTPARMPAATRAPCPWPCSPG